MNLQTNTGNRLTGFYRGKVVKRSSAGYGKCKVFIPGVYPDAFEKNPNMLPDCEQAGPLFGGILNGKGMFSYPNIGAIVWCFFANEDQNHPVYFASTLGHTNAAAQFASCTPFEDDDDGAYFHKICCGQSTITMSELGNVTIENNATDVNTNEPRVTTIIMDQSGNVQINSTKTININTESLGITASKTIQIETNELAIKANTRTKILTPYLNIENNYSGVEEGKNGTTIKGDTMNLNAENGYINVKTKTNGPSEL